jgi:hypothetical protein
MAVICLCRHSQFIPLLYLFMFYGVESVINPSNHSSYLYIRSNQLFLSTYSYRMHWFVILGINNNYFLEPTRLCKNYQTLLRGRNWIFNIIYVSFILQEWICMQDVLRPAMSIQGFMIFLCLQAHDEMVPSTYCMHLMQPSRFNQSKLNTSTIKATKWSLQGLHFITTQKIKIRCPCLKTLFLTIPTSSLSYYSHQNDEQAKPGDLLTEWSGSVSL